MSVRPENDIAIRWLKNMLMFNQPYWKWAVICNWKNHTEKFSDFIRVKLAPRYLLVPENFIGPLFVNTFPVFPSSFCKLCRMNSHLTAEENAAGGSGHFFFSLNCQEWKQKRKWKEHIDQTQRPPGSNGEKSRIEN